ncbi:hypothetical protein ABPG72_013257 [Tetrahymena utriculariae]
MLINESHQRLIKVKKKAITIIKQNQTKCAKIIQCYSLTLIITITTENPSQQISQQTQQSQLNQIDYQNQQLNSNSNQSHIQQQDQQQQIQNINYCDLFNQFLQFMIQNKQ